MPEGLATVTIDPSRQQLIGLKTAAVSAGSVGGTWRTIGKVAVDETRVRHINVKISGFVEQVFVLQAALPHLRHHARTAAG